MEKTVHSRNKKGLSRSKNKKQRECERFLQKERERVRGYYIPSDKPVLQLSGRPVTKCEHWNDWATQILPNTGPTGNPRISFAKVNVQSSQMIQPCWTCGYQNMLIIFQYFYVGPPQICVDHPTYHMGGPLCDPGFFVSCSTVRKCKILARLTDHLRLMVGWPFSVLGSPPINNLLRPCNQ